MSARPEQDVAEADEAELVEAAASAEDEARLGSIEALRAQGDAVGLVALAKAYRNGTAGMARDLAKCLAAYTAAADLGSPLAQHALGLFHLHGGPVEPDPMEAAKRFRAAADGDHLAAKVYVANFYELGIHYRADAAKADVWYRNVARSAGVEASPGTPEHDVALAELGCVRFALALAEAPDQTPAERTRLLRIARIHGYREGRSSMTAEAMASAELDAVDREAEAQSSRRPPTGEPSAAAAPARASANLDERTSRTSRASRTSRTSLGRAPRAAVGLGLTAFLFSCVFMAVAAVVGHVAPPLLAERGAPIPALGMRFDLVLPVALVAIGALPNLLVYRLAAWARAAVLATLAGVAGEVLWGLGHRFAPTHLIQICDLAAAGLLAGLLVFGIFGGAKPGSR